MFGIADPGVKSIFLASMRTNVFGYVHTNNFSSASPSGLVHETVESPASNLAMVAPLCRSSSVTSLESDWVAES